jgi:hypothetical protein
MPSGYNETLKGNSLQLTISNVPSAEIAVFDLLGIDVLYVPKGGYRRAGNEATFNPDASYYASPDGLVIGT